MRDILSISIYPIAEAALTRLTLSTGLTHRLGRLVYGSSNASASKPKLSSVVK